VKARHIVKKGRVSVVIPTRDPGPRLGVVLDGLARTDWPDIEVIVVDNGSRTPLASDSIAKTAASVVRRDIPFNFSRLVNTGASRATGEFLVLLNDDVEVLELDWMRRMVRLVERPEVGLAGALLLYPSGTVQHCGIDVQDGAAFHPSMGATIESAPADLVTGVGPRWAVTGACLMIQSRVFRRLGGLDPLLRTNYNDVDLCLRASRLGWQSHLDAEVRLIHHESATRGTRPTAEAAADWLLFRTRWADELRRPTLPTSLPSEDFH
jgi:GT2 family glycosyltransferase